MAAIATHGADASPLGNALQVICLVCVALLFLLRATRVSTPEGRAYLSLAIRRRVRKRHAERVVPASAAEDVSDEDEQLPPFEADMVRRHAAPEWHEARVGDKYD